MNTDQYASEEELEDHTDELEDHDLQTVEDILKYLENDNLPDITLEEYLHFHPELVPFQDRIDPMVSIVYDLPALVVLCRDFFNACEYERKRLANVYKNNVYLKRLDVLSWSFDSRFLSGRME